VDRRRIATTGSAAACVVVIAASILASPVAARGPVPRTFPFAPPKELRGEARRDALSSLFRGGGPCSIGCPAPRAVRGWPLRPFHRQHVLRAGLNELRTRNLHIGVDILARDRSSIYALQPGRAEIMEPLGKDARVRVGRFIYWHVRPRVLPGQYVRPFRDVVGTIVPGQAHLHLSEVVGRRFLNPLRPRGRILSPWRDRARPVLGRPRASRRGEVAVRAFDPQSSSARRYSVTPVLALAGLAYRIFDARARRRGGLHWAFRGTTHQPKRLRRRIYAPGTRWPRARCLTRPRRLCRPNWVYRLAGGLAPRLRLLRGRRYVLTMYAWDWAGNVAALDSRVVRTRRGYRIRRVARRNR
jgi:hypothetical protein